MNEKTKVRLMVIPIVAMLAVTMVVAGWQHEEQVDIIEEGKSEMNIEYLENIGEVEPIDETGAATTELGGGSELEFEVTIADMTSLESAELTQVDVYLEAKGVFEKDLSLESLKFTASTSPNGDSIEEVNHTIGQEFLQSDTEIDNGSCWPLREQENGARGEETAFIGFDLDDNDFKTRSKLVWNIPFDDEEPYTLELSAIVDGMSEEVSATIDVHITPPDGGEVI